MFTFRQIYRAYLDCRKHKRNQPEALEFECNQEELLTGLVEALTNRSYQPTSSVCFYIDQPKVREIFAAAFRDRVVHHLIYNFLAPVWEKIFIDQSFASRPKKGTHKAARVLQGYLRKITRNGKRDAYYLKLDLHNFFMSINKLVLYELLIKKCRSERLRWLLKVVIFHDPTQNYELIGSAALRKKLPPHKSLFNAPENCGLPIGNLTSQFFANVYLNTLDHFVKHVLKCRFYVRYVDDFILLATTRAQLIQWQQQIEAFLAERLKLKLNPTATRLGKIFQGVDFVGFIIRPFYKLTRRRVVGNLKARLFKNYQHLVVNAPDRKEYQYDFTALEKLFAQINSYLGHFQHAATRRLILKLYARYPFLHEYFQLYVRKVGRKYRYARRLKNLKQQVHYFTRIFKKNLILFQVGCYYEGYGAAAEQLHALTGYQVKLNWRKFEKVCGFHQRLLNKVCQTLESQKVSYLIMKQTGRYLKFTMERVPFRRVVFQN